MCFPWTCVCSFCTDIAKKTSKYGPDWLGNATSNSTWERNSWIALKQRQEKKWAKKDSLSRNHFLSNYISPTFELFLLWSFHIFFLSPFLWPLLCSLPICPVYLDFICYQSHKSSPLCAPRDKKHVFLFSCWISCPAPHRKSTRRCWKRFWNKQIKYYLHGKILPRALGQQSGGLDAGVSYAICGVCSFRQKRVSIRVLVYKMWSFIFSAIPYGFTDWEAESKGCCLCSFKAPQLLLLIRIICHPNLPNLRRDSTVMLLGEADFINAFICFFLK